MKKKDWNFNKHRFQQTKQCNIFKNSVKIPILRGEKQLEIDSNKDSRSQLKSVVFSSCMPEFSMHQSSSYDKGSLIMLNFEEFWNFWISKFISFFRNLEFGFWGLVFQKIADFKIFSNCSNKFVWKISIFIWLSIWY